MQNLCYQLFQFFSFVFFKILILICSKNKTSSCKTKKEKNYNSLWMIGDLICLPLYCCVTALRMFGKPLCSKRLLVSSKVLMHTIPTHDCDIVLMLPARTQDSTLMWLLARLRSRTPQLLVHVRHHSNSGIYGLYMTAKYERSVDIFVCVFIYTCTREGLSLKREKGNHQYVTFNLWNS